MEIKKFLVRAFFLGLISAVFILSLLSMISFRMESTIDSYYARLLERHDNSLILGTSRAAQGIDPLVLNEAIPKYNFYNLSFAIGASQFGKTYFNFLKKNTNLKSGSQNYTFIIAVDPWSIRQTVNDTHFEEDDEFLNRLILNPQNPNFEYLLRFERKNLVFNKLLIPQVNYINQAGRLVISCDSIWIAKNYKCSLQAKIEDYRKKSIFINGEVSETRMKYLALIIDYFKSFGTVSLVRIPISAEMMQLENLIQPGFSALMDSIATKENIRYFDFTHLNDILQTTDGNHLMSRDAIRFTRILADSLKLTIL